MARAVRVPEAPLFSTMNVTPFIDVMLVVLIVVLLGLPAATHKISVDLPNGPPIVRPFEKPHLLGIDAGGALSWDGHAIADRELPKRLAAMQADAGSILHLRTDPEARYARFDDILTVVKRGGISRLGFIGHRPLED